MSRYRAAAIGAALALGVERTVVAQANEDSRRPVRPGTGSGQVPVPRQRQKRSKFGVEHEPIQQLSGASERQISCPFGSQPFELCVAHFFVEVASHRAAVRQLHTVLTPLPELCAGELGGRRVLSEIVDCHGSAPAEPRGQIPQRH